MMFLSLQGVGQDLTILNYNQNFIYKKTSIVPNYFPSSGCLANLLIDYTGTGATLSVYPTQSNAPIDNGTYSAYIHFVGGSINSSTGDPCTGSGTINFIIAQKALTISGLSVPLSKIYDGTVNAAVTDSKALLGAQAAGAGSTSDGKPYTGDVISLTGTAAGTYNTKDVATATTVTYTGISLTGTGSGNYTLTTQTSAATITQKSLTMSGLSVPSSKIYDGTVTAAVSDLKALQGTQAAGAGTTSDGKPYSVDAVSLTGTAAGTYNTKDVATATTVTYTGISLTGTGIGNYTLTTQTSAATITQKPLTITAVDKTKVYGTSNPPLTVAYTGLVTGDAAPTAIISTTALASSTVGTYSITATGAVDPNYTISYVAGKLTVTKAILTITAVDKSKLYGAAVPALTYNYLGLVNGDVAPSTLPTTNTTAVTGSPAGSYTITLSDASDPNYTIGYINGTLSVTKANLIVSATASDKVYDGNKTANVILSSNKLGVDVVTITKTLAEFDTKDFGTGKTVNVTGIAISGADAGNYTITSSTASGIASITALGLTVTATASDKVYDGNKTANVILSSNKLGADVVTLTKTLAEFDSKDFGTGKTVNVTGIAISGTDAGNYTLTSSAASGTASITAKLLNITARPHTIIYKGTAYTGGNGLVLVGLASGESISNLTGTLTYAGTSQGAKNVGSYTIIPGGLSSSNYNINYVGDNLEIKKATLKVIAGDQSVNFGTPAAKILTDATFTYASLLGGDNASTITGSISYSSNYTPLTSTGSTGIYIEPIITGLSATNYDLIAEKGNITITAPPSSPVFQIPNAFTPNSDGHNDTFKIIENGYVTSIIGFKIFTKSGKLIFSDKDGAWDGRYAGVMLDSDVYIWIADFINKNNIQEHLSGTVLLLK